MISVLTGTPSSPFITMFWKRWIGQSYLGRNSPQQDKANDLDLKKAEVRNNKHAIQRFQDDVGFLGSEIARLEQETQKAKADLAKQQEQVKTETEDHNLAIRIVEQSVHVLKTLCGLSLVQTGSGSQVFLQAGVTHKTAQCGEVA